MKKAIAYGYKTPIDYYIMFSICIMIAITAMLWDTPQQILLGLHKINTSRSVLITDYIELAGIGATLMNSAFLLFLNLFLLILSKCAPKGRLIAVLFLTIGFSFFGKNLFNTIPIIIGVWLHGKVAKTKNLADLNISAMIGTTIAPIVSEIAFLGENTNPGKILIAYGVGVFVGFIFPIVVENVKKIHKNFCLYKGGIAGGFIATMCAGILKSLGVEIVPEYYWSTDAQLSFKLATLACTMAVALIAYGIATDKSSAREKFKQLTGETDQNDCDYFVKYGNTAYINIGIMCILATATMLFLGMPINGPVLGGIFTIAGFGAYGKHLRNTIPILIGSSIAAAHFNHIELTSPMNALAILFSTGLAPIAGRFGWHWGILTGFVHVSIAIFIGDINGGLNLYNNGFAGAFVVVIILPIIVASSSSFVRMKHKIQDKYYPVRH